MLGRDIVDGTLLFWLIGGREREGKLLKRVSLFACLRKEGEV